MSASAKPGSVAQVDNLIDEHGYKISTGEDASIKIAEGNTRGLFPVTVAVLRQLGLVQTPESTPLAPYVDPVQRNLRGLVTGRVRTVVELAQN